MSRQRSLSLSGIRTRHFYVFYACINAVWIQLGKSLWPLSRSLNGLSASLGLSVPFEVRAVVLRTKV